MRTFSTSTFLALVLLMSITSQPILGQMSQNPLPKSVRAFADYAEDVIDLFLQDDWTGAQSLVDSLSARKNSIEQEMHRQEMPASTASVLDYLVFRLQDMSQRKSSALQAAQVANQITVLLIDLEDHYTHATPVQVAWMDYLGRELVLLYTYKNETSLGKQRIGQLTDVWRQVQPDILAKGGDQAASEIDQILKNLNDRPSPAEIIVDGKRLLDLVDELEALY